MRGLAGMLIVALLAPVLLIAAPQQAEVLRPRDNLTGPWQLFIDDYLIASKANIIRRYHGFQKYPGNPLIVVDRP